MLLRIEEKQVQPGITVVELNGKLTIGRESQRLEMLVDEMMKLGQRSIIFEMTGVDHIDSTGIGILTLSAGKLKESGGKLVVVAPDGRVLNLLKTTQVNLIVTVCGTLPEAVAAFA